MIPLAGGNLYLRKSIPSIFVSQGGTLNGAFRWTLRGGGSGLHPLHRQRQRLRSRSSWPRRLPDELLRSDELLSASCALRTAGSLCTARPLLSTLPDLLLRHELQLLWSRSWTRSSRRLWRPSPRLPLRLAVGAAQMASRSVSNPFTSLCTPLLGRGRIPGLTIFSGRIWPPVQ
jgi:hypothetical protein